MTRQRHHILRTIMRVFYTLTGFFVAMLGAGVAHDGFTPDGGLLPAEARWLLGAFALYSMGLFFEGLSWDPKVRPK